jgi:polyisoprenoid-binding protein YceI
MKYSIAALCTLLALPAWGAGSAIPPGTYQLDKSHASLVFSVSHLGFSNYTASFDTFDATLDLDPAHPEKARIKATIDPRSLDLPTPPEGFTQALLGKDWLNAGKFPQISFTSTAIEMTGEKTANVHGNLELLGVKKPVVLTAVFNGGYKGYPMDPKARIGFSATTSFNRSHFGMNYAIPLPGTMMGVSDSVKVTIEAEFSGPPLKEPNFKPTHE